MSKPLPSKMDAAGILAYGWLLPCHESAAEIAAKCPVPGMDAHTVEALAFGALEEATLPLFAEWAEAHKRAVAVIEQHFREQAEELTPAKVPDTGKEG